MTLIRKRAIRGQLLLIVLALGLPFLGYLGISSARQARQERAAVGQQMLGVAHVTAARLDDHIGDIRQVLVLLSAVVDTGSQARERNQSLLSGLSSRLPSQTSDVSIWDAQGRSIGSLHPESHEADASGRSFFRDALAGAELAFEAPVAIMSGAEMVSIFSVPIERDGKVLGVVSLSSGLRRLQLLLAPDDPGAVGRVITVTSAEGVVLARSIDPDQWIGRSLATGNRLVAESLKLRDGVRDGLSADGVDRIAGFTSAGRVPWRIYVGVPVEAALAGVNSRLKESLVIGSTLMVLGLALAMVVSRRISDPLQQLETDAHILEQGDLSHRTRVGGFAETESLAITLNRMADALHQRETLLETSRAELRAMLDTDVMGILKVADRHIAWANAGAERLLGYRHAELIGQTTEVFYADVATYRQLAKQANSILQAGQTFRTQQQAVRKDGARIWLDVQAFVLPGDAAVTMAMLVDITPLRLAEEARVRTLALEAHNHQLQESDRLKSAFLSNMSHELRTPLNAVIGLSHLLGVDTAAADPAKVASYLHHIGNSGRQLLGLIDSMLDFAKAESGKLELRSELVDLHTLIRDVVDLHSEAGGSMNIDLFVDVPPDIGEIVTDATRLTQVVSHLLSNAIKFSPQGGRVSLRARAAGLSSLRIEIEDEGIGIAREDLPRLFTAFRQVSDGTTKKYPGAGLGLALTRRIVEALGGSVTVKSTLGVGSVFSVILPAGMGVAAQGAVDLTL